MTTKEFLKLSWKQYLALEADFMQTERYISFEEKNMKTYSQEYIKQLQTICGEIDVQCKEYCKLLDATYTGGDILSYANVILRNRPDIKNAVVYCGDLQLKPWEKWSYDPNDALNTKNKLNKSPIWWSDYNKVKHHRLSKDSNGNFWYMHANLKNTLNALAALYVLCMNFYRDLADAEGEDLKIPIQKNELLSYKDWQRGQHVLGGGVYIG